MRAYNTPLALVGLCALASRVARGRPRDVLLCSVTGGSYSTSEVKRNMMTLDIPTVDESLNLDGTDGTEETGATETA